MACLETTFQAEKSTGVILHSISPRTLLLIQPSVGEELSPAHVSLTWSPKVSTTITNAKPNCAAYLNMSFVATPLNRNGSRGIGYTEAPSHDTIPNSQHKEPSERMVVWGVDCKTYWRTYFKMSCFPLGIIVAVGHHIYYRYHSGSPVLTDDSNWDIHSQQWVLRIGTALAFLAKTFLVVSMTEAYNQHIWTTMKKKSLSISEIDTTFNATNDPLYFWDGSYLRRVKVGATIATLAWLVNA